jgi:hypothetical protein
MTLSKPAARIYNQVHTPRKHHAGRRRASVYVAWSYPGEANRDPAQLDNRFSTMAEVRRVAWPDYEWAGDPLAFPQGIAGSLELFFRSWAPFQRVIEETTGAPVPVFQRVDQAGFKLPLDERVLGDADTLFVWGLDHMVTKQEASADEIDAVKEFLAREGTRLVIGPHHDVGAAEDPKVRDVEYRHHGDPLVPRQQRFGTYTRSILAGLGIPVENRYGLRPATLKGTKQIAPLSIARDLDTSGFLAGVTSFNFHFHLPHYALTAGTVEDGSPVHVLGRQPVDLTHHHPFLEAGNREFNALVWVPPGGKRAGDVLVCDSTVFSHLFGADEGLTQFWKNLVK